FIAPVSSYRQSEPSAVNPRTIAGTEVAATPGMEVQPPAEAASSAKAALARTHRRIPVYAIYLFSAGVLVFLISAGWLLWRQRSRVASPAVPPVQVRKSVAVLGFHSLSGRAADAWLATALAEMLRTELSGGERLRLVSGEDVANLRIASPW